MSWTPSATVLHDHTMPRRPRRKIGEPAGGRTAGVAQGPRVVRVPIALRYEADLVEQLRASASAAAGTPGGRSLTDEIQRRLRRDLAAHPEPDPIEDR